MGLLLIVMAGKSTLAIDASRNRLQMIRIAADRDPAQVVNIESFWNRSDQKFITKSVDCFQSPIKSNVTVLISSISTTGSDPQPTAGLPIDTNFRLQAIRKIAKAEVSHNSPHDIGNSVVGANVFKA